MNERIKELSAIAKSLTTDEAIHLGRIHNRTLSLDELGKIHDQKFAELLIQECINAALEEIVSDEEIEDVESEGDRCYLEGNNGGVVDAVAAIKERFGVNQ